MRRSIRAAALAAALALAGCATPYRHYEGPELPLDKVAVIISSPSTATRGLIQEKLGIHLFGNANVHLLTIDGKKKEGKQFRYNEFSAGQFEVHVLPGKRSLSVQLDGYITAPITFDFNAQAGRRYYLGAWLMEGKRWTPLLADETNNTLIHPRR